MLRLALFFIIFCSAFDGLAQEDYITSRWNFKLGYSRFDAHHNRNKSQLLLEAARGITPYLEAGVYVGYARFEHFAPESHTPFYGITTNFHLAPFLLKNGTPRVDIYLAQRLGGYYIPLVGTYVYEKPNYLDFGVYAGIAYYLGKHFGLFLEKGYSNGSSEEFPYHRKYFRTGFTLKFPPK